jgi:hypothetical protein
MHPFRALVLSMAREKVTVRVSGVSDFGGQYAISEEENQ